MSELVFLVVETILIFVIVLVIVKCLCCESDICGITFLV